MQEAFVDTYVRTDDGRAVAVAAAACRCTMYYVLIATYLLWIRTNWRSGIELHSLSYTEREQGQEQEQEQAGPGLPQRIERK